MPTLAAPLDCAKLETKNERIHNLSTPPSTPVSGQVYFNTTDHTLYWYDDNLAAFVSARSGTGGPPSGAAGGDLAGSTYPNPIIAALAVTDSKVAAANKDGAAGTYSMRTLGSGALQACAGNDSRLSDARAPSGAAGGDLTGSTYPNPVVAALAITDAKVAAANKDGAVGTYSMRTIGLGAQQAMAGNTRLDTIAAPTTDVSLNSKKIISLADPVSAQDAATKNYVDLLIQGLDTHPSVKAATTANIASLAGGAPNVLDGVTLIALDRVLVKDQTTPALNGIYVVTAAGTGGNGTWARAVDQDTWLEVPSAYVWVEQGTVNADTGWTCTSDQGGTLGTTAITWAMFSSAGTSIAGAGLTKVGNTIDAIGTANRIAVFADNIDIASTYVGQSSITTLGTITTGIWQGNAVAIGFGGTGASTAGGARTSLGVPTWYTALGPASLSTTYVIPQSTHNIFASRAIMVQAQVEATGAIILPDVTVASNGDVTLTFSVAQATGTIRATLLGLNSAGTGAQP